MCTPILRSLGLLAALLAACHGNPSPTLQPAQHPVEITELKAGDGEPIAAGRVAVVDYTGWLYDANAPDHKGRVFDSSRASGVPLSFPLGTGQVIAGWDRGLAGMRVHGRRLLTIPPDLAYGDSGAGGVIPPNATLIFDVELVAIQ
jgi:FKBP-type peptidyl-prolyl cis-trans isomerase FkpA